MLSMGRRSSDTRIAAGVAADILETTTRRLILSMAGLSLGLWLFLGVNNTDVLSPRYFALGLLLSLYALMGLRLPTGRGLATQALWQGALVTLITIALALYPLSVVRYAFVLLPYIAVVMVSVHAGLAMQTLVIALVAILGRQGLLAPLGSAQSVEIILGAAILGVIGWATLDPLLSLLGWAVYYGEQSEELLDRSRSRQQELAQIQEDLIQANQQLAHLTNRLRALQQVAEEARQAKTEFVANVSHELRAPLNMIIGFSEMITRSPRTYGTRLPAALLADITTIQRNAAHLSRLVDDVLDLSQIETGRMALHKELVAVSDIVGAACAVVRPLYESKGIYLKTEVDENLPTLLCDETRIRQILVNLLSNAGRFTREGGVAVKVAKTGGDVVFSVSDTGPGIARDDQKRLFEPFQQVDTSIRREHGGSGLGLSISKSFVEMHGGRIWLESEPGLGTTISFSLPADIHHGREVTLDSNYRRWFNEYKRYDQRTRRSLAPVPVPTTPYVLVEQGTSLRHLFDRYGNKGPIVTVANVAEATHMLEESPAQALIVNTAQILSPIDLLAIQQQMPNLPYDTPAIMCWLPGREDVARELCVLDYLVKPVTPDALCDAIERMDRKIETILLVDDEADLLQLWARALTAAHKGYRVWRALSGHEALDIMRQRQPDLIVLDLILPGKDGYRVLGEKQFDETIRDIPVIVVSATDPVKEIRSIGPVVVQRKGGLTAKELMDFVDAVSAILSPVGQSGGPGSSKDPAD